MKFCLLPIFHEIVLWIWTFALFVEFMRKALTSDRLHLSKVCTRQVSFTALQRYFGRWTTVDTWTSIDFLVYLLFFIAFILRLTCIPGLFEIWGDSTGNGLPNSTMFQNVMTDYLNDIWDTNNENCPLYFDIRETGDTNVNKLLYLRYGQYFYVASFMLATIRTLELCTASKHLGPKVKTLFGVLYDLFFFLVILSFFLFAYGVAVQSILYANEWRIYPLLMGVIVKPFFSMFGELFLGENTGYKYTDNIDPHPNLTNPEVMSNLLPDWGNTVCSKISSRSAFEELENNLLAEGKEVVRCPHQSRLIWFLMALYQIIANALLLNLLIAMFSNTFDRINRDAALVWKFQRFDLLKSYHAKPAIIPPLNLIYHPIKWVM